MKLSILAFTDQGKVLADSLGALVGATVERCPDNGDLAELTARHFTDSQGLIYVGAAAIAVRAIAPHLTSKTCDPAVLAIDEQGTFVIPLLSGHLGGANDLARKVAALIEATPVITTATDIQRRFAVDSWARRQGLQVIEPQRIKAVSSKVLAGKTIRLSTRWPLSDPAPNFVEVVRAPAEDEAEVLFGEVFPKRADVIVDVVSRNDQALHLVPRVVVLGVGCRRGVSQRIIGEVFAAFCDAYGLFPEAIDGVATIDLKQDEEGLLAFCEHHSWPLIAYSATELVAVDGPFAASTFVRSVTGVDNVCERAAVVAAQGKLLIPKTVSNGVTLACALKPLTLDWRS